MRKGFTLIELMIVIAIIAIIAAIAIPNLMEAKALQPGKPVIIKATNGKAVIVAKDDRTTPRTWICRIDNGPEANPRYSEVRFIREELELAPEPGHEPVEVEKR